MTENELKIIKEWFSRKALFLDGETTEAISTLISGAEIKAKEHQEIMDFHAQTWAEAGETIRQKDKEIAELKHWLYETAKGQVILEQEKRIAELKEALRKAIGEMEGYVPAEYWKALEGKK